MPPPGGVPQLKSRESFNRQLQAASGAPFPALNRDFAKVDPSHRLILTMICTTAGHLDTRRRSDFRESDAEECTVLAPSSHQSRLKRSDAGLITVFRGRS